jgi:hypothetical protein
MVDPRWQMNMQIRCKFSNYYLTMKTTLTPVKFVDKMLETSEFLTFTIGNCPPSWILSTHRKLLGGKQLLH